MGYRKENLEKIFKNHEQFQQRDLMMEKLQQILFIDDEEVMVEIGEENLKNLGYLVTSTTNSYMALQIFTKTPHCFDLVITDYNMPEMNGDILAKKLREIRQDIPIILSTGNRELIGEDFQKWGIKKVIFKPYTSEKLHKLIQEILVESL
ncbi:MAG: CheY-like chemotaxis protein [bacterium]